ncbi:ATP-binding protein [Indioceanicola profundi]|uniref:ATP-binding protein n=1 Tax=Indioceanicola profundi TaxID=2220096 RepID=UPI0013C4032F|nr:ATP-binding protein [Indioceanicola profundi]
MVLLALAAVLPILAFSVGLGVTWLHAKQEAMEQEAENRVIYLAQLVNRELTSQIDSLLVLAEALPVDGAVDRDTFADIAERVRSRHPLWRVVVLSDPDGNRLIDIPDPVGGGPGKVVDLESHARAVATSAPVVGTTLRGPRGNAAFAIRVPVIRKGQLLYILTAVVEPRRIQDFLLANGLPPDWYCAVVDAGGNVAARLPNPEKLTGYPANSRLLRIREEQPEGFYDGLSTEGTPLRSVYRRLPDFGWSIHVGLPREVFAAPLRQAGGLMLGGGVVCAALAMLFATVFLRELRTRRRQDVAREETRRLEAMGQMTRGVAHDFNNLLQAMTACLSLVEKKADASGLRPVLDAGYQAVDRASRLTRQLLAFARRQPLEPRPVSIRDQLLSMSELMARTLRPDIRLDIDLPPDIWIVEVDPTQFEFTVLNILANARDAMPGPGALGIQARNMPRPSKEGEGLLVGPCVALSVSDTGGGMSPEIVARAFEPFFTTKQASGGTGLGLSQAYGFARQSRGAISIDSQPGRGTTVTLLLPRSDKAVADGRAEAGQAPEVSGGTVLLVEDDPIVGAMLAAVLTDIGYDLRRAFSADEALRVLSTDSSVDIVLSDIVMPGTLSGVGLLREIRRYWPAFPVVLMSGYSEELMEGADAKLIGKPFTVADLTTALEAELRARGAKSRAGMI